MNEQCNQFFVLNNNLKENNYNIININVNNLIINKTRKIIILTLIKINEKFLAKFEMIL